MNFCGSVFQRLHEAKEQSREDKERWLKRNPPYLSSDLFVKTVLILIFRDPVSSFPQLLIIASLDADTLVCGFHEARVGNIGASWPPLYKVCALPLPLGCSPIRATSPRLGKPHTVSRKLFFFHDISFLSFIYIYIFFLISQNLCC